VATEVDLRPEFKQRAAEMLGRLSAPEREALLIKCWMSHDARWFMAVAREYGMQVTNRLNRIAAHDVGKVEAKRILRALQWPPVTTLDDYLLVQEFFISLLGPELLDYRVIKQGGNAYQMHIRRCFAHENTLRAGVAEEFECGIFARITGWLEALGLEYKISPSLGRCLMAQGQECIYAITLVKPE
jgi:hypothetical protein